MVYLYVLYGQYQCIGLLRRFQKPTTTLLCYSLEPTTILTPRVYSTPGSFLAYVLFGLFYELHGLLFVHGIEYKVHGTGYKVHGTGHRVQDTWYRVQSKGYMVQGTWHYISICSNKCKRILWEVNFTPGSKKAASSAKYCRHSN